jgi:hypothetical protein
LTVRTTRYWLGGLLVFLAVATSAAQQFRNISVDEMRREKRIALVIGNANYPTGRLANPANDARAMAQVLRQLGFEVMAFENASSAQFRRAVAAFGEKLASGGPGLGAGLFYYSGHGMQVAGKNYMIPIDAEIRSERYVQAETVDVDSVLGQMDQAKNRVNIIILDACRDNPFARRFRSSARGLAFMDAPQGTYIAYATAPGSTADDGDPGQNGIYTSELLKALREPGLKIEDVFKRVRQGVLTRTGGRQNPWEATNLTGDFLFSLSGAVAAVPRPTESPRPTYEPPRPEVREEVLLGSLSLSSRLDGVEVWLDDQRIGEIRSGRALVVNNLSAGPHRLRAKKAGHRDWEREVRVSANTRSEVLVDVEPLRIETRYEPLPTPAPAPAPAPAVVAAVPHGRVLFEDDFIRTERKAWVGEDKVCAARYESAGYWVKSTNANGTCEPRLNYAGTFSDRVRIETMVTLRGGPQNQLLGIKFGRASNDNNDLYAVFGISTDGSFRLTQWHQGKWNPIIDWTKEPAVRTGYGATNHLAVEVSGRKIRCYVNDKFVGTGTALADVRGYLGFFLNEKDMEATFTSLRVTELQ